MVQRLSVAHSFMLVTPRNRTFATRYVKVRYGPSPSAKSTQSRQLRQHSGSCAGPVAGRSSGWPSRSIGSGRQRLNTKELSRAQSCIFCASRPTDRVSVVDLLAPSKSTGKGIAASKAGRECWHHDFSRNRSNQEGRCYDEALSHQHHHEEGDERADVGGAFRVSQLGQ